MRWIRNAVKMLLREAVVEELDRQRAVDRAIARELADVLEQHHAFVRREAARRARAVKGDLAAREQNEAPAGPAGQSPADVKSILRARLMSGGRAAIIAGGVSAQERIHRDHGQHEGRGDGRDGSEHVIAG